MKKKASIISLFCIFTLINITGISAQTYLNLHTKDGNVHPFDLAEIDSITFTAEQDTIINNDLAAYYPFSGDASDESANGNHGIVYGAELTQDRHGNMRSAYHFDGLAGDFIYTGTSSSLNLSETGSIVLWVYISSYGDTTHNKFWHLLGKGAKAGWDTDGYAIFYHDEDAVIYGAITDRSSSSVFNRVSFGKPATGQWHHLAFTWDGEYLKSYINGEQYGAFAPQDISIPDTGYDLVIGKKPSGRRAGYFHGTLDEVYIFRYALSKDEIQQIYSSD